jgi:hypothetical protein
MSVPMAGTPSSARSSQNTDSGACVASRAIPIRVLARADRSVRISGQTREGLGPCGRHFFEHDHVGGMSCEPVEDPFVLAVSKIQVRRHERDLRSPAVRMRRCGAERAQPVGLSEFSSETAIAVIATVRCLDASADGQQRARSDVLDPEMREQLESAPQACEQRRGVAAQSR